MEARDAVVAILAAAKDTRTTYSSEVFAIGDVD
jgi:hypothetical protein